MICRSPLYLKGIPRPGVPLSALDLYRPTDYDNAVAACKPIWDAAQAAGVLLSDSSRYVKSLAVGFGWVKLHSLEGVRVEIEPAAPRR